MLVEFMSTAMLRLGNNAACLIELNDVDALALSDMLREAVQS